MKISVNDTNLRLLEAARMGDVETLLQLKTISADWNTRDSDGATPLILATRGGHGRAAKILLDAGADVNARDSHGETALMSSGRNGSSEIMHLLLDAGADVNAEDNFFQNVICHAVEYWENEKNTFLLLNAGVNLKFPMACYMLCAAAYWRSETLLKRLLQEGADTEARDPMDRTPLMYAAKMNMCRFAEVLIEAGADVKARDKMGRTPLDYAERRGHLDICARLQRAGGERGDKFGENSRCRQE